METNKIPYKRIWFDDQWLYGERKDGTVKRQSVLWYARLMKANTEQRNACELDRYGMHWDNIDEDISWESFDQRDNIEPDAMQRFFLTHGELTVSGVAKMLNIHPSLLFDYINGWKKPSAKRVKEIEEGIRAYGRQLEEVSFAEK